MKNDEMAKKLAAVASLLRDLAAAVEAVADVKENEEKQEEMQEETGEQRAEAKKEGPKEKKYSLEEVRRALAEKSGAGYTEKVKELLQKHGAERLSAIAESEYAALMEEVQTIGGTQ